MTMPNGAVHTLYLPGNELPAAGPSIAWLVAAERAELAMLSDERRRREWLAGRWAAKQLLIQASMAGCALDVEICSRDAGRRGSRPRIRIAGQPFFGSLSIAHTSKGAIAALAASERLTIGVDLVNLDEMAAVSASGGFARLWYTPLERCWIVADQLRRTATLWGIKEAVYKACQRGETWSPRDVVVWPQNGGYRCTYQGHAIDGLRLEVQQVDRHLAVVASLLQIDRRPVLALGGRPSLTAAPRRTNEYRDSWQHELLLGQAS